MSRELELLTEIRDLLEIIAEPALAKRDAKFRSTLKGLVGESEKKAAAVGLMDGSRTQASIAKTVGIDRGNLSRLVKSLAENELISTDQKHPKLLLKIPQNLFIGNSDDE